jgi:hypothetical protein
MRLAGGVLSSCSRNGSMLVSKKRSMGFGPLGIPAEAGFGNDGRNAAELRRADGQNGETRDVNGSGLRRSDVEALGQTALTGRTRRPRNYDASARTSG